MPRYLFTGNIEEVFPTIVTADGVLVAQPGESYDLDTVDHPRLVIDGARRRRPDPSTDHIDTKES